MSSAPVPADVPALMRWDLAMTALSSISHKGDATGAATALFRREKIIQPDGRIELVPIISGNSLRGILRRLGEGLLRECLGYSDLPLSAAHALTNGGSLAKAQAEPLSGRRLAELRSLNPLISIFGCCGGGRMINGCLQVGKVIPVVTETLHLLQPGTVATLDRHSVVALESYSRIGEDTEESSIDGQMRFSFETLPAGTRLSSWVRLEHPTAIEVSFLCEVLEEFRSRGHLGGRRAVGHGQVAVELTPWGADGQTGMWRSHLLDHRDQALEVLTWLT